MEESTAAADCWNVLVVTGSTAEEGSEFIMLSAEPVCRVMLLEAVHTSDPPFDPAMILLNSIIQVDVRLAISRPRVARKELHHRCTQFVAYSQDLRDRFYRRMALGVGR